MKAIKHKDIDEYIAGFPKDIQVILEQIRATVKRAAPEATEAIKYDMQTFILNGNLVHFAAFKKHIGFYRCQEEKKLLKRSFLFTQEKRVLPSFRLINQSLWT